MSLILEALRRSEAERQLGHAPDVLTPMPVLRASPRVRYWPWWTALAVVLAGLALWGMWGMWRYMQQRSVVATPVITTKAPGAPRIPVDALPNAASEVRPSIATTTTALTASRQPPSAIPPASTINTAPAKTVAASAQSTTSAEAIAPSTPIPAPAPIASEAPPAAAEALLSIADLSPGERAGLPTLKVSMHVYADQPGDRFMIVDGARVGEGARIGDRIVLVQIRRDGGVLDIGGRRVLLPKP
jgi:general secretion pathway protein B